MSDSSLILGLPYIQAAQAQKHVTHNEALRGLDQIVQLAVLDDSLTLPPAAPTEGDRYLVAPGATGEWAAQDASIALYETGSWQFQPPLTGWQAWVQTRANWVIFDGADWQPFAAPAPSSLDQLTQFGLNAIASATTPFVATLPNALWQAVDPNDGGTGSVVQSMSRVGSTTDAGFALQTDYLTHGLFGFFGSDQLRLSTSGDGVNFQDALRIDPATGILTQPQRPRFKAYVNYDSPLQKDIWGLIPINMADANDQNAFDPATNLFTAPVDGTYLMGGTVIFAKDTTTTGRAAMRLVRNGTEAISGGEVQNTGGQSDRASGVSATTLVALSAGDTVGLWGRSRTNAALAAANMTSFWGYLLP